MDLDHCNLVISKICTRYYRIMKNERGKIMENNVCALYRIILEAKSLSAIKKKKEKLYPNIIARINSNLKKNKKETSRIRDFLLVRQVGTRFYFLERKGA